jgi:hypothetical protein
MANLFRIYVAVVYFLFFQYYKVDGMLFRNAVYEKTDIEVTLAKFIVHSC